MPGSIAIKNSKYDDAADLARDTFALAKERNVKMPKRVSLMPYFGLVCYTTNAVRDLMIEAATARGLSVAILR